MLKTLSPNREVGEPKAFPVKDSPVLRWSVAGREGL